MLRTCLVPFGGLVGLVLLVSACSTVSAEDKQKVQAQNYAAQHRGEDTRIAAPGMRRVAELRPGNCIDATSQEAFEDVKVVDCSDPSATVRVTELSFVLTPNGKFPGESWLDSNALAHCARGADDSFYPTKTVWDAGSRVVVCLQHL